jgi:hypothetical protein
MNKNKMETKAEEATLEYLQKYYFSWLQHGEELYGRWWDTENRCWRWPDGSCACWTKHGYPDPALFCSPAILGQCLDYIDAKKELKKKRGIYDEVHNKKILWGD